ncbi:putative mitochondrial ribosomal protein S25 [Lyophyllum shimeji]|uniref:Small ribosomal subunit protein mS23 n=1 Tax=Lyophyllum shimeji TaxID=47721 RepID=A0A9P3UJS8_LYOSH|nr:putative mitochondrial ribosomal protein S25 [Lyophyllum shimeji]
MRGDYIKKQPAWYQAVLDHPPLPLPPKAPPPRTAYDQPTTTPQTSRPKPYDPKPVPIAYLEDKIRRQFFRDHPFEAFRPTTLVESAHIENAHPIQGKDWTRLRQRGRNPSPEDAIRFALNLHEHHNQPLAEAYKTAVAQFRALRSEHYVATTFAVMEAEYLGAVFSRGEIAHAFEKEKRGLDTFERREELDEGAIAARKRWKAVVERTEGVKEWTKGEEYVRLWKEGVRPTYAPLLTRPLTQPEELTPEQIAMSPDFVGIQRA